ncbi:MAG: hypothetical protein GF375_01825 [Candidatus Omnitrophica bacterium]|nr:hypothetical protein [Candidatus Omnitrophota bacterium]MBD3268863.1 hypothetical protein [Candidatus Omnitrophota bacterium]
MKDRARGFLLAGIIITAIFASHLISDLIQVYKGAKNIWWTPKTMMLSLDDTENEFRIFISGKPLSRHLEEGLFAKDNEGKTYRVVAEDVGVRLNNWCNRKVSMLQKALWSAFGAGFGIALLIAGLNLKFFLKKKTNE